MDIQKLHEVFNKLTSTSLSCAVESAKNWDIIQDGNRVVIEHSGLFRCFISKAYELKTKKKVMSAHMVLYNNKLCENKSKLQSWNPESNEKDSHILKKIIMDLHNIETYYELIN